MRVRAVPVAMLSLLGALAAQAKVASPVEKRARSLVNQLELAERRAAAAEELLALGAPAVPALAARLADPRPEVVQVVCEVLGALGSRAEAALPFLVTSMGSPDPDVARMATLTESRLRATGLTTICEFEKRGVVQFAADGTERVLQPADHAWDVDVLPAGHLLVTFFMQSKVVEYDNKGKEVWSFDQLTNPLDADRLLDGRTLIADTKGHRVIEVSPRGDVVWEWKLPGDPTPYDVERLANGRTLIAMYPDQVLEVDRKGDVVWELRDLGGVFSAERLPDGNTLLALFGAGAVQERNKKGDVVWEVKVHEPNHASRLANGNTMVSTGDGVLEFAPDGKQVGEIKLGSRISRAFRR